MSEILDNVTTITVQSQEQVKEVMDKLFSVAHANTVFNEPITAGDYTVITASEVSVGAGFGLGLGGGSGTEPSEDGDESQGQGGQGSGLGGGGGGGGASAARPVAVISIGPDGVRVEPVVDPTKIGLAFLTMLGSVFVMAGKIRKAAKG